MADLMEMATRKIGPFPAWAWGAGATVLASVVWLGRHHSTSSVAAPSQPQTSFASGPLPGGSITSPLIVASGAPSTASSTAASSGFTPFPANYPDSTGTKAGFFGGGLYEPGFQTVDNSTYVPSPSSAVTQAFLGQGGSLFYEPVAGTFYPITKSSEGQLPVGTPLYFQQ